MLLALVYARLRPAVLFLIWCDDECYRTRTSRHAAAILPRVARSYSIERYRDHVRQMAALAGIGTSTEVRARGTSGRRPRHPCPAPPRPRRLVSPSVQRSPSWRGGWAATSSSTAPGPPRTSRLPPLASPATPTRHPLSRVRRPTALDAAVFGVLADLPRARSAAANLPALGEAFPNLRDHGRRIVRQYFPADRLHRGQPNAWLAQMGRPFSPPATSALLSEAEGANVVAATPHVDEAVEGLRAPAADALPPHVDPTPMSEAALRTRVAELTAAAGRATEKQAAEGSQRDLVEYRGAFKWALFSATALGMFAWVTRRAMGRE